MIAIPTTIPSVPPKPAIPKTLIQTYVNNNKPIPIYKNLIKITNLSICQLTSTSLH